MPGFACFQTIRKCSVRFALAGWAALMLGACAAPGGPVALPAAERACDFTAWVPFNREAPVPVREAPSPQARQVGTLPPVIVVGEDAGSVEFEILAARDGWLRIGHATAPDLLDAQGKPVDVPDLYQGVGWIPGDAAQLGIQSARGYTRPQADAPLQIDLGGDWLTDMARIEGIRGCAGAWLLIDYRLYHRRTPEGALVDLAPAQQTPGRAWFRGACANQYTTCDMPSVDRRR